MTLNEIASILGNKETPNTIEIIGMNTLRDAKEGEISFLSDSKYEKDLSSTKASAVILPASKAHLLPSGVIALESDEAYLSLAKISKYFAKSVRSSDVEPIIGEGSVIYPTAHIENGARIGKNSTIMSGVYIGAEAVVGDNVILYPNVTVYRDCI
ncbi:MAG: LpxD N-terminal domain-containing protein, partial [Sulfuricurvum sp.]|nr:LpxD N-terminal domain-containing protein [Sulfuricurvum sp.]